MKTDSPNAGGEIREPQQTHAIMISVTSLCVLSTKRVARNVMEGGSTSGVVKRQIHLTEPQGKFKNRSHAALLFCRCVLTQGYHTY